MSETKIENWLEPIIKNIHSELKQQQAEWKDIDAKDEGNLKIVGDVRVHKPVCWSLDELYKDEQCEKIRVPKANRDKIMSAIQANLDAEGITAKDIIPEFKQHNSYLELRLNDGRSIRIMDDLPFGDPVKSEKILPPEKEFTPVSATTTIKNAAGVDEPRTNKFHVAIFPKYKKLEEALASTDITTKDAEKQIRALKEELAEKEGLLLWDPWMQNFGIDEKGKIFVSSSGAVCKEEEKDIKKPFYPYADVTIAQLEAGGYKNLPDMLEEATKPKIAISEVAKAVKGSQLKNVGKE